MIEFEMNETVANDTRAAKLSKKCKKTFSRRRFANTSQMNSVYPDEKSRASSKVAKPPRPLLGYRNQIISNLAEIQ
jgi:hypothetical protein